MLICYFKMGTLWLTVNMKTREIHHSLALPRMVTRVLKELSQPKSEVSPPDGLLAVSLLRHQRIALSWMVQKKTSSLYCCSGIKIPISRSPSKGYRKLQAVLKIIMLRRTKGSLLDGEPIISLPPKSVELKKVEFSQQERDFYSRLEADSRAQFQEYANAGTVKQNYVNILLMLLRLRQACDHPLLVKHYNSNSLWKSSVEMAKKLPQEN